MHSKRLGMKHLIATLILSGGATTHATVTAESAGESCRAIYRQTNGLTKSVVGEEADVKIAPLVQAFLDHYEKSHRDMPSIEIYRERLRANKFSGDDRAAYNLLQSFSGQVDRELLTNAIKSIVSYEKFAGAEVSPTRVIDPAGMKYAACLRDYVSLRLRNLSENSYYDFKPAEILRLFEGSRFVNPTIRTDDVGGGSGSAR